MHFQHWAVTYPFSVLGEEEVGRKVLVLLAVLVRLDDEVLREAERYLLQIIIRARDFR